MAGRMWGLVAVLAAVVSGAGSAQARPEPTPLPVGSMAPAFALPAATKDGVLPAMAKLEDFRGQTVVLAFFYRARTGG